MCLGKIEINLKLNYILKLENIYMFPYISEKSNDSEFKSCMSTPLFYTTEDVHIRVYVLTRLASGESASPTGI